MMEDDILSIDIEEFEEVSLPDNCLVLDGVEYEEEIMYLKSLCDSSGDEFELYLRFLGESRLCGTISLSLNEFITLHMFKDKWKLSLHNSGEFRDLFKSGNYVTVAMSRIEF